MKEYMDDSIKVEQLSNNKILYHYTDIAGLKGIIDNKVLWASRSNFLNDKQEFLSTYIIALQVIESLIMEKKVKKEVLFKFNEYWTEEAADYIGPGSDCHVLSFSNNPDNLTLWSEFSGFMGYNLSFKYSDLLNSLNKYTIKWKGKVVYKKSKQLQLIKDLLWKAILVRENDKSNLEINIDIYFENLLVNNINEFNETIHYFTIGCIVYSMFFKNQCFAAEDEYRFVFSHIHTGKASANLKFRTKCGVFIPYIEISLVNSLQDLIPLNGIMVGPINNTDLTIQGLNLYLKNINYNIPISFSEIPLRYI